MEHPVSSMKLTVLVTFGHVTGPPKVGLLAAVLQHLAVAIHLGGAPFRPVRAVCVGAAVVLLAFVGEGELALHLIISAVFTF